MYHPILNVYPAPRSCGRGGVYFKIPLLYSPSSLPHLPRMPVFSRVSTARVRGAKAKRSLLARRSWSPVLVNQGVLDVWMPILYLSWCFCHSLDIPPLGIYNHCSLAQMIRLFVQLSWVSPVPASWCCLLGLLHPAGVSQAESLTTQVWPLSKGPHLFHGIPAHILALSNSGCQDVTNTAVLTYLLTTGQWTSLCL